MCKDTIIFVKLPANSKAQITTELLTNNTKQNKTIPKEYPRKTSVK